MSSYPINPPTGLNKAPDARANPQTAKRGAGRSKPLIFAGIALALISLFGFIYTFYPLYTPKTEIIDLKDLSPETRAESAGSQPTSKLYSATRPVTPEAFREIPSNTSEQLPVPTKAEQQIPSCPQVSLECPKDEIEEGQPATFTAKVGGDPDARGRLTFTWRVIPERKFNQGKPSISVDVSGLAGRTLSVELMVGGIDRRCGNIFGKDKPVCSVRIIKSKPPESETGGIAGRVAYTDGTSVAAVTVRVANRKTGFTKEVSTSRDGRFIINDLPNGTYDVSLPHSPFSSEGPNKDSTRVNISPQTPLASIELVGQKSPPPTPTVSPTVSPSPTESPTPTITPTISPSISPQPRPASDLEPGEAGIIKVIWPPDLAKNWRGTIKADYIPPPGGKRPRDLIEGYTASASLHFKADGLKSISSDEEEKPLDDSSHEWSATVEPEENAGSVATCTVLMEIRLKNRETGETKVIRKEVKAPLTVSTAPVTRNQSLGLSTGIGVMGLGLIGFGSRRRAEKRLVSAPRQGELNPSASGTGDKGFEEILETAEPEDTHYKQISAWITEREKEPQRPLRLGGSYTLNFKVGQPVVASLLRGPEARVPETDIPEEGLDTEWIVVSRSVRLWELPSAANNLSVTSKVINDWSVWTAKFPLHIPKQGESEIVQLGIAPWSAEQTGLDIYIHVRGELYRQLEVKFVMQGEDEIGPIPTGTDGEASHART